MRRRLRLRLNMPFISKDTPAYYFTVVAKDRLPVFRTPVISDLTCKALDEARKSGGFLIFAYVIMPDHIHFITDSERKQSVVLRFANGIISRRVIDYLKANNHTSSLQKLRHATQIRQYSYSLWSHDNNSFSIHSEDTFLQKVNYIHMNPVRAGLVERAEEYRCSSVRCWLKRPDNEPLDMDLSQIRWHEGAALRR
jgi:putative transposase